MEGLYYAMPGKMPLERLVDRSRLSKVNRKLVVKWTPKSKLEDLEDSYNTDQREQS